jgi:hypothetical protein
VHPSVQRALTVDVQARVVAGEGGSWSAEASTELPAHGGIVPDLPDDGTCAPAPVRPAAAGGSGWLRELSLTAPAPARLVPDSRGLSTSGPLATADPAWAVGDLAWTDGDGWASRATAAVRFGPAVGPVRVERNYDGSVDLAWSATDGAVVRVLVPATEGMLACIGSAEGLRIAAAMAPPRGVPVVVESVVARALVVDGTLLRVRAAVGRTVSLDSPDTAATPVPPRPAAPARGAGPRHVFRNRPTTG